MCLAICPWSRQRGKCVERCRLTFSLPLRRRSQTVQERLQGFCPVPPVGSRLLMAKITRFSKSYGILKLMRISPEKLFCCVSQNLNVKNWVNNSSVLLTMALLLVWGPTDPISVYVRKIIMATWTLNLFLNLLNLPLRWQHFTWQLTELKQNNHYLLL